MLSRVKCVPERNGRNITHPVFNLKERLEWDVGGGDVGGQKRRLKMHDFSFCVGGILI